MIIKDKAKQSSCNNEGANDVVSAVSLSGSCLVRHGSARHPLRSAGLLPVRSRGRPSRPGGDPRHSRGGARDY